MKRHLFHKGSKYYSKSSEPYLRPLDRNDRAKILFFAESLDRKTKTKGSHGGIIKRTGIIILKTLLYRFHNLRSGQCDPSAEAIAAASGVSRSQVFIAIQRLEAAGLLERYRRIVKGRQPDGSYFTEQTSNAYAFNFPYPERQVEGDLALPLLTRFPRVQISDCNQGTIYNMQTNLSPGCG